MLNKEIEKFIELERNSSLAELSLKLSKKKDWPKEYILNQINGRQKVKQKFPFLNQHKGFIFPSPRAFAQASSEKTAQYKASLIEGKKMADLSGGMGIDSYFFSKVVSNLAYVEKDQTLFEITKQNFELLQCENISPHLSKAEDFLLKAGDFDCIYIDPDRRDKNKRLFKIEDCSPNLIELLPTLLQKSNSVMIKLSPFMDIKLALKQLPSVEAIHVVAVDNDCKELLFIINPNYAKETQIHCIHFNKAVQTAFTFTYAEEDALQPIFTTELMAYLYEPNVSISKSGAFKSIAVKYKLYKLAPNTHLYTSDTYQADFPGKILKVDGIKSAQQIKGLKANVVSKNFPLSTDEIRRKYKIKEGKTDYIYACSLANNSKVFIQAKKVN